MKYSERIYSESEIKLISEIFDMCMKRIYDEDLNDLIIQCKEMFLDNQRLMKENQKSLKETERLNNIIKRIEKCIDYYAIENDDFSKFYNNEEIEILKIIGSDKE